MVNTKKLFKTALEGVVSSSLVATGMLTQLNLSVKAVTPTKPSDGMFIEKAKLRDGTYGLSSGKKVQKVYFGHNPHFNKVTGTRSTASDPIHLESGAAPAEQGWFIAGSQATGYGADGTNGGFVLLCDPLQPMIDATVTDTYGGMPFLAEGKYEGSGETGTFNKTGYSQSWGCTYEGDAPAEGSQVYANHFGGSDIWKKIKEYQVQEDRFTSAEQSKMENTTGWTYDSKNSKYYSTTSKLYLGVGQYSYGESDKNKHYFMVGKNEKLSGSDNNATSNGLKVGLVGETGATNSPYTIAYEHARWFWLRSPNAGSSNDALRAWTGNSVLNYGVHYGYRCVPACALNLQSIAFASAAVPATASSSALSDGVYLRFADDENKLGATATTSGRTVTIVKGSEGTGDVYLALQGNDGTSDWISYRKLTGTEALTANDIRPGVVSFENCKMWIETTENNVTYAEEIAVDGTMDKVNIVNNCKAVVELHDKDNNPITTGISLTLKDSANNEVDTGEWSNSGTTFESEKAIPTGNYTLSVTWAGNTLAQSDFTIAVNGAAQTVKLTKVFPLYVKVMDGSTVMTNEDDIRFTLSKGGEAISTSWSYNSDTKVFSSNKLLAEGNNYDLGIALHGSALSQTQWDNLVVDGTTKNECSLSKTYPVYIKLKDSLGNEITDADNMTVTMQKGEETPISLPYNTDNESFEPAKNVKAGTYTLTVTKPAGAKYELAQNAFEVRVARALDKTITITKQCPVHIALQDNIGRVITGTDAAGITLKLGATTLSEDTTPGIFKADNIPEGSYTLTVTVNEGSSKYLTPKVTSYPIEIDADEPSTSANPHRIIRFKPGIVGTGRVVTGVGGDAGYRYDRKSGVTKFYCNPAKGYQVDKIEKDSKGIVRYVSFKLV